MGFTDGFVGSCHARTPRPLARLLASADQSVFQNNKNSCQGLFSGSINNNIIIILEGVIQSCILRAKQRQDGARKWQVPFAP